MNWSPGRKKTRMHLFHRWTKWIPYETYVRGRQLTKNYTLPPVKELYKKRQCEICGKEKHRLIKTIFL